MSAIALAMLLGGLQPAPEKEMIVFEAFELQPDGGRKPLERGGRKYSPTVDVKVIDQGPSEGGYRWSKSLVLFGAYELGASVYREKKLEGFGLWIKQQGNPNGFSWEWFDLEKDEVFTKRQGTGRVKVAVAKSTGMVELAGVEFLDDVVLRYRVDTQKGEPGTHTHEILIKKGSVLKLPPSRPTKE